MRTITLLRYLAAASALIASNACGAWDAPYQNGATVQALTSSHPDLPAVSVATQGLFVGLRNNATFENVHQLGMFGREGLDLDLSNPQFVTQTFQTGGDLDYAWVPSYQNDKQANLVLAALNTVTGMSDQEKEASRGFIQTIKAIDLLYVIQTSDQAGAILDVPIGHKDDSWSFPHFDTITVSVADAPRPDEILVVMAIADGGRLRNRCGTEPIR